jgi:hypothetical protein
MRPPNSLTDEELMKYANEHIAYEILMLMSADAILRPITPVKHEHWLVYACNCTAMTSYALHARNLIDFLYLRKINIEKGRKGEPRSDVVVEDYIPNEILEAHRPPLTPTLDEARKKADKQAAHLTSDRIAEYTGRKKVWQVQSITRNITTVFHNLASHFPPSKTSDAFRQFLLHLDGNVPPVDVNCTISDDSGLELVMNAIQPDLSAWPNEITGRHFQRRRTT